MSSGEANRPARLGGDPPAPLEERFGFCRVVTAGDRVIVGGTTSIDPTGVVLGETPYDQAVHILHKIEHELSRVGVSLEQVVRTRIYVTDISRAEEVGRAHGERFADAPPAMTMVEVSGLIDPRMMVEIEAEAQLG